MGAETLQRVHCNRLGDQALPKLRTRSAESEWGSVSASHPFPTQVREVTGARPGQPLSAGRLSHIAGRTARQRDSGWVVASPPSRPEPRLLPHPQTGSSEPWVELPAGWSWHCHLHRGRRATR